jgi:hypothetical protein
MTTIARIASHRARTLLGVAAVCTIVASACPAGAAAAHQKSFPTAEDAVQALVTAAKANDTTQLLAILGSDAKPLISSGDPVADERMRARFVSSYDEEHDLVAGDGGVMILQTGKDHWPSPIPLVKGENGWRFDTAAGKGEILTRRIGKNELETLQSCLAYVDAQRDYYDLNPEGGKLRQYAQHIASSKGTKDGLYWDTKEGEPDSPLGPLFATARREGYAPIAGKPIPYHGYFFHILTAQGSHAPGGAYDYVAHGKMIGGFALIAYPAEWGSSGIMTFLVNQEGVLYEKDLGPDTTKVAQAIKSFDPDDSWTKVNDAATAPISPNT